MAKRKRSKEGEYIALVGFDVKEGRWEQGEQVSSSDIADDTIKHLLKHGDIEVKNGDSEN